MHRLLALLEEANAVLHPFTLDVRDNTLVYNGTAYAPYHPRAPDPYALAWLSSFKAIIGLLGGARDLTAHQKSYLRRSICGGMGSFADFALDEKHWGVAAIEANRRLDEIRSSFFAVLDDIKS